jgi:hypothetical protein
VIFPGVFALTLIVAAEVVSYIGIVPVAMQAASEADGRKVLTAQAASRILSFVMIPSQLPISGGSNAMPAATKDRITNGQCVRASETLEPQFARPKPTLAELPLVSEPLCRYLGAALQSMAQQGCVSAKAAD